MASSSAALSEVRNALQGESCGNLLRKATRAASLASRVGWSFTVRATFLSWSQKRAKPLLICTERSLGTSRASSPMCRRHINLFRWQSNMVHNSALTARFLSVLWAGGNSLGTARLYIWWTATELAKRWLINWPLLREALPRRLHRPRCRENTLQTAQVALSGQGGSSAWVNSTKRSSPPSFRRQRSVRQLQRSPQIPKRAAIVWETCCFLISVTCPLIASCTLSGSPGQICGEVPGRADTTRCRGKNNRKVQGWNRSRLSTHTKSSPRGLNITRIKRQK